MATKWTREERRLNRKHVLDALKEETGSSGGSAAASRVNAYRKNPLEATTEDFTYVGALTLDKFYIDPTKPNTAERRNLWTNIVEKMGKPDAAFKTNWDRTADVATLQVRVESAK